MVQFLLTKASHFQTCLLLLLLLSGPASWAQPTGDRGNGFFLIKPYTLQYEARYRGFRAAAVSNLGLLDNGQYQMENRVSLKLLGQELVSIRENSHFRILGQRFISDQYQFIQEGIGSRERRQNFNHNTGQANVIRDDKLTTVPIEGEVLDELNAFLYLRRAVSRGEDDIRFMQLDRDEVKQMHYQVLGEEQIDTPLGTIETLVLERVREPGSERSTKIWLAPQWDYLMVKLEQVDPDNHKMTLQIEQGNLDGEALDA